MSTSAHRRASPPLPTSSRPAIDRGDPAPPRSEDEIFARWLTDITLAHTDATEGAGQQLWRILCSAPYASLWYAARDAGEAVRARALAQLYAHRPNPGGPYPDPREPAAFSERAILTTAARQLGLNVWQRPTPSAPLAQQGIGVSGVAGVSGATGATGATEPIVWLITFPVSDDGQPIPPTLALHEFTPAVTEPFLLFEMACMLGFITKHQHALLDPNAPPGVTLMPHNPGLASLLHQFAIALLCLDPLCPQDWTCHCNRLRAQYNAAPPDHDQPTDTLTLADLQRHT